MEGKVTALSLPESKEQLMSVLDSLNHAERINYAARLGRDHKDSPKLKELINSLLTHPTPEAPQMEVEEEFVKILPPQKTNVAKYYHEDQVAMTAAVASQTQLPLIEESLLQSPSIMFKKLLTKAFVRQEKDDNKVFEAIVGSVPKVQKKLIHGCIRYRRIAILEKAFPVLRKEHGVDYAADFLHGCSPAFVEQQLQDEEVRSSKAINWSGIGRHHGKVIIELIRKELKIKSEEEEEEYKLSEVWNLWQRRIGRGTTELLRNTNLSGEIVKLAFEEYPDLEYIGDGWRPRRAELDPKDTALKVPSLIGNNFSLFIAKHPEQMLEICKRMTYLENAKNYPLLKSNLPSTMWSGKLAWRKLRSNRFEWISALLADILSKSTPASLFGSHKNSWASYSYDRYGFGGQYWTEEGFWDSKNFSASQMLKLAGMLLDFLMKFRPSPEAYASWSLEEKGEDKYHNVVDLWRGYVNTVFEALFSVINKEQRILDIRTKILEGPAPYKDPAAATPATNTRARRGRGRQVAVAVSTKNKKKRVHKWETEEQKAEERQKIQRQQKNLQSITADLLKKLTEFAQPAVWEFEQKNRTPEQVKQDRLSQVSLLFSTAMTAISRHPPLVLEYFEKIGSVLAKELDREVMKSDYKSQAFTVLKAVEKVRVDPRRSEADRDEATKIRGKFFETFFKYWKDEPVINNGELVELMPYALPEQRLAIFELFDEETLTHMGETDPSQLENLFENLLNLKTPDSKMDFSKVYTELDKLLQEDVLSREGRDLLLPFKNVEDHKIRKEMTKAADSNNSVERSFALRTLLTASRISQSPVQMKRTLTFFRTKLKNEAAENRVEGLSIIVEKVTQDISPFVDPVQDTFTNLVLSEDCLPVWDLLLKDALEAPDLSEEPSIIDHFKTLSTAAISRGAGNTAGSPLFEFGVEIQWKIAQFQMGAKKSSKEFRIKFAPQLRPTLHSKYFPLGAETQFVEGVMKAYSSRVLAKNPKFFDGVTVMEGVYMVLGKGWVKIPALVEHAQKILAQLKQAPLDTDGLYIIKADNEVIETFEKIFAMHHAYKDRKGEEWYEIPVLVEYVDTVLKSRQAPRVLFDWLLKNSQGKTRKEKQENKSKCVFKLLEISPSAIHLRFVWRFLMRFHQNKLDQYLNAHKTYRGVFYLAPKHRKPLAAGAATRKTNWASSKFSIDVLERIRKEQLKEEKLKNEKADFDDEEHEEGVEFDSATYFVLPGTFGLHRLLPRQANLLAQQRKNQTFNENLSLPDRVSSSIRWTLAPTTDYADVVQFFNKYEKGTKALPVNILEAVLRGVMHCDEPCAPLQFLLSPKFLGSDRARVAMYCVSKCVPFMPASQMTETLLMVLTGKRRNSLKVTAYKEIIRLLASRPTQKHMEMVQHEWDRPLLHRDVRITVVQKAVSFLVKDIGEAVAWDILKSCLTVHAKNAELEMALLGITPAPGGKVERAYRYSAGTTNFKHLCLKPRLYEHYEALTKSKVPEKHCKTFFEQIIYPLATGALDDDVKHLAIAVAPYWREYADKVVIAKLLQGELVNVDTLVLANPKLDVQAVHNNRWFQYMTSMCDLAGITQGHYGLGETNETVTAIRDALVNVLEVLCDAAKKTPLKEREVRANLQLRLNNALSTMNIAYCQSNYPKSLEKRLVQPFKSMGTLFYLPLLRRRVDLNKCLTDWSVKGVKHLHKLFKYAVTNPSSLNEVNSIVDTLMGSCYNSYYEPYRRYAHPLFEALLSNNLAEGKDADVTQSARYKALVHKVLKDNLRKFPEFFSRQVVSWIVDSFSYVEDGDIVTSAPTSNDTFVNYVVDTVSAYNKQHSVSNGYDRSTPTSDLVTLLQRILLLTFNENSTVADRAIKTLQRLCNDQPKLLVEGLPAYLGLILHQLISYQSRLQNSTNDSQLYSTFAVLVGAIEGRMKADAWGASDEDPKLSEQVVRLLSSMVTHPSCVATADPLGIPEESQLGNDAEVVKQLSAAKAKAGEAAQGLAAYQNVVFELVLQLVAADQTKASFIVCAPQAAKQLIHQAIVRSIGRQDRTPALSGTAIIDKVKQWINCAYDRATNLVIQEGEDERTLERNAASRAKVDRGVKEVLVLVNDILSLSLLSAETKKGEESGMGFLLSRYRHVSVHLAFDVVSHFGTKTMLEVPKAEEPKKEEKEKKEEPEKKPEGAAAEGEDGEDEEEKKEKEEEAKKSKSKKKKKAAVERIWRNEFVEVLDKLSEDEDSTVRDKALYVTIRSVF